MFCLDYVSIISIIWLYAPKVTKKYYLLTYHLNSRACLLGNLLEVVGVALARPACPYDMAIDFATVATLLLEVLPPIQTSGIREETSVIGEDDMIIDDAPAVVSLSKELEKQISNAIDPRFLLKLTNVLFGGSLLGADSSKDKINDKMWWLLLQLVLFFM